MRGLIFPLWPMKSQQCILDLVTHDCKRRCQHYSYGAWRHAGRTSAPAPISSGPASEDDKQA